MGAGASVGTEVNASSAPEEREKAIKTVELKKLPEAIEESIYVHEKFPLIIDTTEQAGRFLKYQTGTFISFDDPIQSKQSNINQGLVGAIKHGRTLTIKFKSLEGLNNEIFIPGIFPVELLSRERFFMEDAWKSVLPKSASDEEDEITISTEFVFIICTNTDYIPPELWDVMHVIKVVVKMNSTTIGTGGTGGGDKEDPMDQIAALFGAKEIIRNSTQLVEAAFDGDLEEVKAQLEKGYHLESVDGRKHTALSEAASQGHMPVIQHLLEIGADPNSVSDTGRSPLWRAAFNGHAEAVKALLNAGGSPEFTDKVSMESAFDVAQSEEVREILNAWDLSRTALLMEERRRVIAANLEARIKTSAEREFYARNMIRKELVDKANNGDIEGIKMILTEVAAEAEQTGCKPRATAEVRNDGGQSLLSIAAQNDYFDLALWLLTYYKDLDKDRWDLLDGEISPEARVFKANPNSRDMKGWTCACIAVFHDSRKVLKLLLEHGGDPNIRSSYNKNAWDLAKDELDAAEKVIKSNAEIRQVLIDNDQTGSSGSALFGTGKVPISNENLANKALYEGLGVDGSPIVMQVEMNKEGAANNCSGSKAKKGKGKSSSGTAGAQTNNKNKTKKS